MSPAECTPVGFVVTMSVVGTIVGLAVILFACIVLSPEAPPTPLTPQQQRAQLAQQEENAILRRARQLMEAGMTYAAATAEATREREAESQATLRSLQSAEHAIHGGGRT